MTIPGLCCLTNTDRQAAARALLRSQSHLDGTHYHTRTPSGLHPTYIAFNDILTSTERRGITHEEFVEAALEDVFDVLTTQDCLDGGLSLLVHCPGSQIADTISPDHVAVDLYAFCEEFAVPHLKQFMERCRKEDIIAPHRYRLTDTWTNQPQPQHDQRHGDSSSPRPSMHDSTRYWSPTTPLDDILIPDGAQTTSGWD
ncbi:hypothetical protein P692DRAFT_20877856 [Suillus brevipes Sb2]|nr:hypothetical protein P692DRAFT_20877856 [Suillus brevipes Sb2]